jgi:purine-binding chemotaxis protein CheW
VATTIVLAEPGKYLTFALADEEYGLPVLKVREIIKMMEITQVPKVPPHVKGVINLRGKVIPIVDLRLKFGFPPQEATERTCIIVVDAALNGGRSSLGFVVDGVSEVMNITAEEIEPTPDFGEQVNTAYLRGIAKRGSHVKMLLDLDRVLSSAPVLEA